MMDGLHGTNTLKETVMKKILALIVLSIAMVSCYEDYLLDYPITAIYFANQMDVRTFIVGEGMKFEVGASLGGVRQNTMDRNVSFILDPTLITADQLTAMKNASWAHIKGPTTGVSALLQLPANYYQMTPSTTAMVIKTGWHGGTVVIKADSVNFLNDSVNTILSTYVLPFRITSADADTVLKSKNYNVVGTKFENKLFGSYWHGGVAVVKRTPKSDTTMVYPTTIPAQENMIWTLTTSGPRTLTCNGYYMQTTSGGVQQLNLVLKGTKIYLSAGADASYPFTSNGECTFNNDKLLQHRKIFLKYQFTDGVTGYTYQCTDTLTFRNRMHDGVNEWQDGDPSHYTK
jgi:hypothetical protein